MFIEVETADGFAIIDTEEIHSVVAQEDPKQGCVILKTSGRYELCTMSLDTVKELIRVNKNVERNGVTWI